MPSVTPDDDAPLLADLMPWSVAPPRLGRGWPTAPDAASLKARWDALMKAEGPDRETLFEPTRSRTPHSAVGRLPGQDSGTEKLARATGPCAEPVRVLQAPFDEQWLIPDHRLIDAARPELWRVADERQVFVVEAATASPDSGGPLLLASSLLPLVRPGRIRPLYRRPAGTEPNRGLGAAARTFGTLGEGLEKSFGKVHAVRGLDLAVAQGTVCRLIGPNRAGRTTAVRLLTTLPRPDAGSARARPILGAGPTRARRDRPWGQRPEDGTGRGGWGENPA